MNMAAHGRLDKIHANKPPTEVLDIRFMEREEETMRLDERGKQCPLPVIEAKKALEASAPGEKVEVVVDNEIAVQNLSKMADHKGLAVCSEKAR